MEGGELLSLVHLRWQKKVLETGLWHADLFMKVCSLSLERLLNLKGVASYVMLSDTCLDASLPQAQLQRHRHYNGFLKTG